MKNLVYDIFTKYFDVHSVCVYDSLFLQMQGNIN